MYCQVTPESNKESDHGEEHMQMTWALHTESYCTQMTHCYFGLSTQTCNSIQEVILCSSPPCRKNREHENQHFKLFPVKLQYVMDLPIPGRWLWMYCILSIVWFPQKHINTCNLIFYLLLLFKQNELMQWMLLNFITFPNGEMLKKVKLLRKQGTYMSFN